MVFYKNNRDKKGRLVPKFCKSSADIRRYYISRFQNGDAPEIVERLRVIAIQSARACDSFNNGCNNKTCSKFKYYSNNYWSGTLPKDIL